MRSRQREIFDRIKADTDRMMVMHEETRRKAREKAEVAEAIIPVETVGIVRPIVSVDTAVESWKMFQDLKTRLLDENDYVTIRGRNETKRYIVKSGWRKLAAAFGLVDEILQEERESENDGHLIWRVRVRVTHPTTGRFTESVGSASTRERMFQHPEHDVRSLAHTRAKSRGISDLIGGGGDVGDDVLDQPDTAVQNTRPQAAQSGGEKTLGTARTDFGNACPPKPSSSPEQTPGAEAPASIVCPSCKKPVARKYQGRTKSYYYLCENHVPQLIWDKDGNEWGVEKKP